MKRRLSTGWKTTEADEFPALAPARRWGAKLGELQPGGCQSRGRAMAEPALPLPPCSRFPPRARSPYIKSINRKFHFFRKKQNPDIS